MGSTRLSGPGIPCMTYRQAGGTPRFSPVSGSATSGSLLPRAFPREARSPCCACTPGVLRDLDLTAAYGIEAAGLLRDSAAGRFRSTVTERQLDHIPAMSSLPINAIRAAARLFVQVSIQTASARWASARTNDHLVPLELGGSNDMKNFWVEAGKAAVPCDRWLRLMAAPAGPAPWRRATPSLRGHPGRHCGRRPTRWPARRPPPWQRR